VVEKTEEQGEIAPLILSLEDYRLPIYQEWDSVRLKCPHNLSGWVAYHYQLLEEKEENNVYPKN